MPSNWTNKGKKECLKAYFRNGSQRYIAVVTGDNVPNEDTNTLGELTEIAAGNGYPSGGYPISGDATGFDVLTEDDNGNRAFCQIKDVVIEARGGSIPARGNPARYLVLTDANATKSNREVIAFFDLVRNRTLADTDTMPLQNLELGAG